MRRRLAASFVLVAFVVLALFTFVRLEALRDLLRDQESIHLHHDAVVMAQTLDGWSRTGTPVDSDAVRMMLAPDATVQLVRTGAGTLEVTGSRYDPEADDVTALVARASSGSVSLTMRQSSGAVRAALLGAASSVLALAALLVLLAGVVGYFAAMVLAAPFQKLAQAAGALGRGRSDLVLPASRIPEVRVVADALRNSARQLAGQRKRDQEFLQEASHQLRTPMTGIRLELEELQMQCGLDRDVHSTIERSIRGLDNLQSLTTGIFAIARASRAAFEGSQVTVEELAQQTADTWAVSLAQRGLGLSATVEGDLQQRLTPGPVEQVLEQVLDDLRRHGQGEVRVTFIGSAEQLAVTVGAEARNGGAAHDRARLVPVRQMVEALAGRCVGDPVAGGLRIWLPRQ